MENAVNPIVAKVELVLESVLISAADEARWGARSFHM
jgi:hypothetical protein